MKTTHLYQFKEYGSRRILTEFFEDTCRLQKGRTGHFAEKDLRNRKHRAKARERRADQSTRVPK